MTIIFAPSELDYDTRCSRCFYLKKVQDIRMEDFPPPVFSSFDRVQQRFFKSKKVSVLTDRLPEGSIIDAVTFPNLIISKTLADKKGRSFVLRGKPDIVIKFDKGGYGIIDFKTTTISATKAENYRYQLESYAQIFTHPGALKSKVVPKLSPITHMGVLQFYPESISSVKDFMSNCKLQMSYASLRRDVDGFYTHITKLIDILSKKTVPGHDSNCPKCKYIQKIQSKKKA